ncbi:MAG: TIGR03915 family putative DNA repair protein [bacterium]|nr:TIGR03915 family putative DNA repair protein [bacterium]
MYVFTCKQEFEDMMCCIYTAWERALRVGHDQLRLEVEPVEQMQLFDEYIHVDADHEKFEKVTRSIQRKISMQAFVSVYYVAMSNEPDAIDVIYRFLIRGFSMGEVVLDHLTDPCVQRFFEIRRSVGNEAHFFREFARFTSIDNRFYVCHLEPKNNVILFVGEHFADRMPSEHWMIIDDNRSIAVVHPKDGENYLRTLTTEELREFEQLEDQQDLYTDMWKTFFDTIAIRQRENRNCQRNMIRIWMRKHVTEFR